MASGGKSKRKHPEKYKKQYHRTTRNKERAWAKHLEAHPKDLQNNVAIPKAKETLKRSK